MDVLFAAIPVSRFHRAVEWYSQFFGRAADIVVHDHEVMWRVTVSGWLYVLEDSDRAGHGLVTIAVPDLDAALRELAARGIDAGPIEEVGDAAHKAKVIDPDGNEVALIHVTA
jgi:predicted enzyme related to lactoylglutathione lyase